MLLKARLRRQPDNPQSRRRNLFRQLIHNPRYSGAVTKDLSHILLDNFFNVADALPSCTGAGSLNQTKRTLQRSRHGFDLRFVGVAIPAHGTVFSPLVGSLAVCALFLTTG
jgi:hypothetical protein